MGNLFVLGERSKQVLSNILGKYNFIRNSLLAEYLRHYKNWLEGISQFKPAYSSQALDLQVRALRGKYDLSVIGSVITGRLCFDLSTYIKLNRDSLISNGVATGTVTEFKITGRGNIKVVDGKLKIPKTNFYMECSPPLILKKEYYGYVVKKDPSGDYSITWLEDTSDTLNNLGKEELSMTTIAVSEGMMASDGQATKGHVALPGNFKKIHLPDEATEYWEANGIRIIAFGVCGQAHSVEFIKEYLRKGVNYKTRVEHADELDFEAVLITEQHDVFAWDVYANKEKRGEQQFLVPCNTPYATGSGGRLALAAMCVGQNAAKAVKTASKLDVFSGGDVDVFEFPPKPVTKSVRPEHLVIKDESKAAKPETTPSEASAVQTHDPIVVEPA